MSGHGSIQIKGSWPLETPKMVQKRGFGVWGGGVDPVLWLSYGYPMAGRPRGPTSAFFSVAAKMLDVPPAQGAGIAIG